MDHDPEFDRPASKRPSRRRSWPDQGCLAVGLVLIWVLGAYSVHVRGVVREGARRAQCVNCLKQIAVALHEYEERHGTLPPANTVDATGRPLHSWRTLILPFLEEEELYRRIDLNRPWDDPSNAAVAESMPHVYACPSGLVPPPQLPPGRTTYLAAVGPDACSLPGRGRSRAEITSDPAATLLVIEANPSDAVPWMAPSDADAAWLGRFDPANGSPHAKGRNVARLDGYVESLKATTPPALVRELTSISRPRDSNPDR